MSTTFEIRKSTVRGLLICGLLLPSSLSAEMAQTVIAACTNAELPEDRVRTMVTSEAERQGVDAKLVLAIAQHESGFGAQTNSPAGARGIMQLIPATAKRYGVSDICDAEQNIRGGVRFLKDLSALFDGNIMLIAAAYNAGENRVITAGGIPATAETVNYTAKVTNTYFGFQNIVANARDKSARQPKTEAASVFSLSAERNDPIPINSTKGAPPANNWLGGSVLYVQ